MFYFIKYLEGEKEKKKNLLGLMRGFVELTWNELERGPGVIYSDLSSHRAAKGEVPDNSELDTSFTAFT